LHRRLEPLHWLTNNAAGVSIPVARNIYTAFIRSVVDYLSPALSQLSRTVLDPLENFQNKIMRCILGCPIIHLPLSSPSLPPSAALEQRPESVRIGPDITGSEIQTQKMAEIGNLR